MKDLFDTKLFRLLSEPSSEITNEEMQNAYGNFIEHVKAVSSGNDYTKIYRDLNITRIELSTLEPIHRYEQGKKCPEIRLSSKSIGTCRF